jgi:E1A/CREB-binding protein
VGCQQKVTGGCGLCKKMWCLLNLHAKSCTTTNCPVPRCRCDIDCIVSMLGA